MNKSGIAIEAATVDHTGIDVIAYHKKSNQRFGISVKTRTRKKGAEKDRINLDKKDIVKITEACLYFAATPAIGLVIDRKDKIDCLMLPLDDLLSCYPEVKTTLAIGTNESHWDKYSAKRQCLKVSFEYKSEGSLAAV